MMPETMLQIANSEPKSAVKTVVHSNNIGNVPTVNNNYKQQSFDPDHFGFLQDKLNTLRNNKQFCDVILEPFPVKARDPLIEKSSGNTKITTSALIEFVKDEPVVTMVNHVTKKETNNCGVIADAAVVVPAVKAGDDDHEDIKSIKSSVECKNAANANGKGVVWQWYDAMKVEQVVSTFGLITVTDEDRLGNAMHIMKRENVHQLPVVSASTGLFLGMVTSADIMRVIITDTMSAVAKVKKVMTTKCPRVERGDDLSVLIFLLDKNPFVAVVDKLSDGETIDMVMTPVDLLDYYSNVIARSVR